MPRNRQPLGSSETVQDMPLPAIKEQIETLMNTVHGMEWGESVLTVGRITVTLQKIALLVI